MKRHLSLAALFALVLMLLPLTAAAQSVSFGEPDNFRPYNQRGVNLFEPAKVTTTEYNGLKLYLGGAFTQQMQALSHSNNADAVMVEDKNANQLVELGTGFNTATANLLLGAELAEGIQVNLVTYLSSRHHSEAWVKGGYLQVDELAMFNSATIDRVMDYVTIRAGHFEINYGDAHFRRTDNGMAMYNPFVGNLIMDAFTTEIGGEVYVQTPGGLLGMVGITGGEIKGTVTDGDTRAPSFYGKLGVDRQVNDDLRLRLTGSAYTTAKSANNTLYGGDRTGSRYYDVLVNASGASFTNGRFNPGFRSEVTAFQLNPFVKFGGLEVFGTLELASGASATEADTRTWNQYAVDALYRFLDEQVYVGGRYNVASGELAGSGLDVSIDRMALGAGWFVSPHVLVKGEYVRQQYNDFPTTDILHEGTFNGFVIEGVVAF